MRTAVSVILAALLALLRLCSDTGEEVQLVSQPMTMGRTPVILGAPRGLPVHGKEMSLTITVSDSRYHRDVTSQHGGDKNRYTAIYGPDGDELTLTATLVGADGTRSAFGLPPVDVFGKDSTTGIVYKLYHYRAGAPRSRPIHVEVTASAPVNVSNIRWWTGDPGTGMVP